MKQPIKIFSINLIAIFAVMTALTLDAHAGWFSFPSADLSVSPTTISSGQQATLSWSSEDAWAAEIDNGVGDVDLNGSFTVSPSLTTTYEITVRGGFFGVLWQDTDTVTVTVLESSPPVADSQNISVNEGSSVAISLTGSDSDNDPISFTVASNPVNGSLSGVAPNLTYTPHADFSGLDSFTFIANDGQVDSAPGTISITVIPLPLKITILEPVNLTSVPSTLAVHGTLTTAATYVNVDINGKRAAVQDGKTFFINELQLQPGDNEIIVQATDSQHNQASATINVFVDANITKNINLHNDLFGTVSCPTELEATLSNLTPDPDSATVRCAGPGAVEISKISDKKFTLNFNVPGLYTITYMTNDSDGISHSASSKITIGPMFTAEDWQDMEANENALIELYQDMIVNHDIETVRQRVLEAAQNNPAFSEAILDVKGIYLRYKDTIPLILDLPDPDGPVLD